MTRSDGPRGVPWVARIPGKICAAKLLDSWMMIFVDSQATSPTIFFEDLRNICINIIIEIMNWHPFIEKNMLKYDGLVSIYRTFDPVPGTQWPPAASVPGDLQRGVRASSRHQRTVRAGRKTWR